MDSYASTKLSKLSKFLIKLILSKKKYIKILSKTYIRPNYIQNFVKNKLNNNIKYILPTKTIVLENEEFIHPFKIKIGTKFNKKDEIFTYIY